MTRARPLYVLVDGENLLSTYIKCILHREYGIPSRKEYPDFRRLLSSIAANYGVHSQKVKGYYFINASKRFPTRLIRLLSQSGFRVIQLNEAPYRQDQLVDRAIDAKIRKLKGTRANVVLVSHDGGYHRSLMELHNADPERSIAVVGFPQYISRSIARLPYVSVIDIVSETNALAHVEIP